MSGSGTDDDAAAFTMKRVGREDNNSNERKRGREDDSGNERKRQRNGSAGRFKLRTGLFSNLKSEAQQMPVESNFETDLTGQILFLFTFHRSQALKLLAADSILLALAYTLHLEENDQLDEYYVTVMQSIVEGKDSVTLEKEIEAQKEKMESVLRGATPNQIRKLWKVLVTEHFDRIKDTYTGWLKDSILNEHIQDVAGNEKFKDVLKKARKA